MAKYRYRWDVGTSRLLQYETAYRRLMDKNPQATFFNTWEWLTSAIDLLVPSERQLVCLTVWLAGELVALVPFSYGKELIRRIPVRTMRLLGDPMSDRETLVTVPDESLIEYVLQLIHESPWKPDIIILSEIPGDSCCWKVMENWRSKSKVKTYSRLCARVPVVDLNYPDIQSLLGRYSKSLRTLLRRARKKIDACYGDQGYRVDRLVPRPEEVSDLLAIIKSVEDRSWKGGDGVGIFSTSEKFNFIKTLSEKISEKGWLMIYLLWFEDKIVSYRYGFFYNNVFLDYNLAYLPEYGKYSPGRVLLDEIIQKEFEQKAASVDASRVSLKSGHQLQEWPCRFVEHYRLWIFNHTIIGLLMYGVRQKVKPFLCRIGLNPAPKNGG